MFHSRFGVDNPLTCPGGAAYAYLSTWASNRDVTWEAHKRSGESVCMLPTDGRAGCFATHKA